MCTVYIYKIFCMHSYIKYFNEVSKNESLLVSTVQLKKKYKSNEVLTEANLELHKEESIALLGKNGSGKTTLVNILSNELKPSNGIVNQKANSFIMTTFHENSLYEDLTLKTNLNIFCLMFGFQSNNIEITNFKIIISGKK